MFLLCLVYSKIKKVKLILISLRYTYRHKKRLIMISLINDLEIISVLIFLFYS
jgi:hypothetical protein